MDLIFSKEILNKIKHGLVFFLVLLYSCNTEIENSDIGVNYLHNKAISVTIKAKLTQVDIYLKGSDSIAVLGNTTTKNNRTTFRPIVPFLNGATYLVRENKNILGEFTIRELEKTSNPRIVKIYPSANNVPQNLLKFYIEFSEPMQAIGKSLNFIKVMDLTNNREQEIFLELENELWNADRTLLTLWLDPGRIKKDLIPNKEKGLPLEYGHNYRISISNNWKSLNGTKLNRGYEKTFLVTAIDSVRPTVSDWSLSAPLSNSKDPLIIKFNESLDAQLALETISVNNEAGVLVMGRFYLENGESSIQFKPNNPWKNGNYKIQVESRLEDLAGNNLNRLFDSDLHDGSHKTETRENHYFSFSINDIE